MSLDLIIQKWFDWDLTSSAPPTGAMSGVCVALSVAEGRLVGAGALAGATVALSVGHGQLAGAGVLSGPALALSPGVGAMLAGIGGASLSLSPATGQLAGTGALAGATVAQSVATGLIQSIGSGSISGVSVSLSFATGAMTGAGALAGATVALSVGHGQLAGAGSLSGVALTLSPATGLIQSIGSGSISGVGISLSLATGAMVGAGALAGATVALSVGQGQLGGLASISGTTVALSVAVAPLSSLLSSNLSGISISISLGTGSLAGKGALSGAAIAQTFALGNLSGLVPLSGRTLAALTLGAGFLKGLPPNGAIGIASTIGIGRLLASYAAAGPSIRELWLEYLSTALSATTGLTFYRTREAAVDRAENVVGILKIEDDETEFQATGVVLKTAYAVITIIARGDVPELIADPAIVNVHSTIMADPTLGGLAAMCVDEFTEFEFELADRSAVAVTMRYRIKYTTLVGDLTRNVYHGPTALVPTPTVPSVRELMLEYIGNRLINIIGFAFYRTREAPVDRSAGLVVTLRPEKDETEYRANRQVLKTLHVRLTVIARGDTPDQVADSAIAAVHSAIMADQTMGGLAGLIIDHTTIFDFEIADRDAVAVEMRYRIRYSTAIDDLTRLN